jgi:hypothetical protein
MPEHSQYVLGAVALLFFGTGILFFSQAEKFPFLKLLFEWCGRIVALIGMLIVVLSIAAFVLAMLRGATGI